MLKSTHGGKRKLKDCAGITTITNKMTFKLLPEDLLKLPQKYSVTLGGN